MNCQYSLTEPSIILQLLLVLALGYIYDIQFLWGDEFLTWFALRGQIVEKWKNRRSTVVISFLIYFIYLGLIQCHVKSFIHSGYFGVIKGSLFFLVNLVNISMLSHIPLHLSGLSWYHSVCRHYFLQLSLLPRSQCNCFFLHYSRCGLWEHSSIRHSKAGNISHVLMLHLLIFVYH